MNTPIFSSIEDLGGITPEVVATFLEVMRAHEHAVRPDLAELTEELVRGDLESPYCQLDESGVWSVDGRPVMVAMVTKDVPARNIGVDAYGLPDVDPAEYAPLFERAHAFALTTATADADALTAADLGSPEVHQPDSRIWQWGSFCRAEEAGLREFFTSLGLVHARNFHRMMIEVSEAHDALGDFPGLDLVPATTADLQRDLMMISKESFREHWGSSDVERTFDEWKAMRESSPGFTWDRAWIARLDGVDAGLLIVTDLLEHERTDYVWTLGVLKPFRGRGLGKWLLLKSFHDARKRGLAKVALNVDAENSTGAVRLYESLGMRPTEVYVAYRAPVR